jgi:anti-sigma-K factor RskA
MEIKKEVTGQTLLEQGVWSSKSMWKAISAVAVSVFVITMIYAQFLSMQKTIDFMSETHEAEMEVLTERVNKQNERLVAADDKNENDIEAVENAIVLIQLDQHEPAPGQKRTGR